MISRAFPFVSPECLFSWLIGGGVGLPPKRSETIFGVDLINIPLRSLGFMKEILNKP